MSTHGSAGKSRRSVSETEGSLAHLLVRMGEEKQGDGGQKPVYERATRLR